ncbi:MAG: hypothetical protein A3F92_05330 [Candidatus Rokubacteria bacterium RIFCSPLOWO2_12_FULL_71_22]|nr:MAG: hypothetical protein A3F92_05330 [Candidatus Rokubacteria bacterium RIFCSPLOWO2_12_FULL_71_22]
MIDEPTTLTERRSEACPFLVSVTADRLWLYPVSAYCRRPPRRVRVPAPSTLERVCSSPGYRECVGYRASTLRCSRQADVVARLWGGAPSRTTARRHRELS